MVGRLGIIAGGGALPDLVANVAKASGREIFVLAIIDHALVKMVEGLPHAWIHIGEIERGIDILHKQDIVDLIMVGSIRRPTLHDLHYPDFRTIKFFTRLGLRALGDDGLLKAIISELESEGFRVLGLQDVLGGILAKDGVWGNIKPNDIAKADIEHATKVAHFLGVLDIGQAVVVQQGIVLGVEAIEGTDALLNRVKDLRRSGSGGVLVKIAKLNQERRVDLPTIGVQTVKNAAIAGLAGIAVEVGLVIVIDYPMVVTVANDAGLFICGVLRNE
ncbi:MAG: UDP-2,3-diacylglucosamine diphosphatase LpxI [Rhodospirillaceae bacterium]|nr:UDP-2,3-diacylglucosamine diphosphatase LpxI [Rhodospirillaceae bacterium]